MSIINPTLDQTKVKLGITPTSWWNDDFIDIDIGITFGECVSEMAYAGFHGCSIGHKYPKDPVQLKKELDIRGLQASEPWTSTYFTINGMKRQTISSFKQSLDFIKALGGTDMVIAELGRAVHPLPVALFDNRPVFTDSQWNDLISGITELGEIANGEGMRLCYHPHMGTGVMIESEVDRLMEMTDPSKVHLLFDTGHLQFAGADPLRVATRYGSRIKHIHLKNVRQSVIDDAHTKGYSFRQAIEGEPNKLGVFTVPGDPEGTIDMPPILTELAKANFEGWLVVEAEQDPAKAWPLKYAKMARQYLSDTLGW